MDHHDEVLASLPLTGARLTARPLMYYVYTSPLVRSGPARCMLARIVGMIMAKNKPADNQFTLQTKYLVRIIAARWNSMPTVGLNEPALTIQVKLSILCTAPSGGPNPL